MASVVLLVAAISSVEGDTASLEAGLAHGLRAGDVGQVFYSLKVGAESRRVEVGEAVVTEVDELAARCRVLAGKTRPGFLVEFELPADRADLENTLPLIRSRLTEMQEAELEEPLRQWIDRLIPQDPGIEETVVRLLRERHPARLGEGRVAEAQEAVAPEPVEVPGRDRVLFPARTYLVGVDLREARTYSQQPRFAVDLKAFLLDPAPVTRAEFLEFRSGFVFPDSAGVQATGVSWVEAEAYCRWRGLRLPTEFEWEIAMKASQGGGGLLEWTASWYKPYPGNQVAEPEYGERFRVVRGATQAAELDVHRRLFVAPDARHRQLGFRCVEDPVVAEGTG